MATIRHPSASFQGFSDLALSALAYRFGLVFLTFSGSA
jgi:hypothetical protein